MPGRWHFVRGYEHELVAGEWRLAVFIDDVEVARTVFHVRRPPSRGPTERAARFPLPSARPSR
ncbi:DUF3859 domain-containing protein [Frigoriglobus tundricola]|uniref:Uncharacterized protein n=1 Tax=Frigoriglobus tundricola TaxID=2774151 RepID=A0A6M5YZL2_9BACT|nr:DUF3859 domain-containing protein [Frigoriglobus tundricola]QJW98661.1 hypothetical protein FTUN_6256 [Frigoriglobus tundricola]